MFKKIFFFRGGGGGGGGSKDLIFIRLCISYFNEDVNSWVGMTHNIHKHMIPTNYDEFGVLYVLGSLKVDDLGGLKSISRIFDSTEVLIILVANEKHQLDFTGT